MISPHTAHIALFAATALTLAGCGDGGDSSPTDQADVAALPSGTPSPGAPTEGTGASADADTGAGGSATLTVGDETWEFDNFWCGLGHDVTQSQVYSFTSDARGESSTGAQLQMQANVRDDAGEGRLEGEGVVYEISIHDIDNFDDPTVSLLATSDPLLGQGDASISLNGDQVTAEGDFFDERTYDGETTSGTLEATCAEVHTD